MFKNNKLFLFGKKKKYYKNIGNPRGRDCGVKQLDTGGSLLEANTGVNILLLLLILSFVIELPSISMDVFVQCSHLHKVRTSHFLDYNGMHTIQFIFDKKRVCNVNNI